MATITLTSSEIVMLKQLRDTGGDSIGQAWRLLGEKGDTYAFLAGEIVASNEQGLPLIIFWSQVA